MDLLCILQFPLMYEISFLLIFLFANIFTLMSCVNEHLIYLFDLREISQERLMYILIDSVWLLLVFQIR